MDSDSLEKRLGRIEQMIAMVYDNHRKQDEYLETILHAVCESNDEKTEKAIRKYLNSEFGNRCK
jgi:alpha-D-ribose 1-methylphosphonate 5-triphosphate diphosphatase PhnM